jgi:hypothetical protein
LDFGFHYLGRKVVVMLQLVGVVIMIVFHGKLAGVRQEYETKNKKNGISFTVKKNDFPWKEWSVV